MARVLLISIEDVKKITPVSGNLDSDFYNESIFHVQLSELIPIIGRPLYDKLIADVIAASLTGVYLTLVDDYIKYFLSYWAASDYALLSNYKMSNGGTSTYQPDNASANSTDEVIRLTERLESKGKFYGQQMIDYLIANKSDFPEYTLTTTSSNFRGWVMGDDETCWDG